MNQDLQTTKEYLRAHKAEVVIGVAIIACLIALIGGIVFFVNKSNTKPEIVYQPADACEMFTREEAKELLGERLLRTTTQKPTQTANTAVSKCGYTDGNPEVENMVVAAVVVRSGINDEGTQLNKTDFAKSKPKDNAKMVKDLGEDAYFDEKLGQLNILRGHEWIILSYGVGEAPGLNTVEQAVELAHKVIASGTSV